MRFDAIISIFILNQKYIELYYYINVRNADTVI